MFELPKELTIKRLKAAVEGESSRIYGLILYKVRHAHVVRMLRDEAFWDALDDESGPRWPIFAVRPTRERKLCNMDRAYCLTFISLDLSLSDEDKMLQLFNLNELDLPCMVFFIWDDDDVLQQVTCPIKGKNKDEVYECVHSVVEIVAKSENQILPQYRRSVNLYREVENNLKAYMLKTKITSSRHILEKLYQLLSSLNCL